MIFGSKTILVMANGNEPPLNDVAKFLALNVLQSSQQLSCGVGKHMRITPEMPWAAKRPANESLTVFFTGPPMAQFYLLFPIGPLTIFEIL